MGYQEFICYKLLGICTHLEKGELAPLNTDIIGESKGAQGILYYESTKNLVLKILSC